MRSLAFVGRIERLSVSNIRKQFLQFLYILMIPDNRMLLKFLLLLYLLLIVVPIPKVVIASNMRKDGINNGSKCSFVLVVNRKLHEIILEVVILQPNELERGELLPDVLKQIWDKIYVEGSLCTETGLGG